MTLRMKSPSFEHEMEIPVRHTCEGADLSPPLVWSGVPEGTRSFAIVVDDPDAPDPNAPKMTWVHWVVYGIPADVTALPEGVTSANLPSGAREGLNDWRTIGYRGPCPPVGRHRYLHKLYALDTVVADLGRAGKAEVERALRGHVLGQATLIGTYVNRGR